MVPAGALDSANESAGALVGFETLVVNNGERLPALKFVSVPAPPLSTNQVQGGNPVCKQTCKRLSVRLKYSVPGSAPLTSESVYVRAPSSGTVRFRLIAGGMMNALMFSVAPVIVRF